MGKNLIIVLYFLYVTSNHPSLQNEKQPLEVQDTIKSILQHFEEGDKIVEYPTSTHPNVVLVLGNSGVGKSTLVHYTIGDNSQLISTEIIDPETGEPTGDYSIKDTKQKIGNSAIYSHTKIPELMFDTKTNTSFYDCPGFEDNRNAKYDIAGTYFTKKILDRAKKIKFVFVVNYASVIVNSDKQNFLSVAKHATDIVKNVDKFKNAISLIATKVNDEKSDQMVLRTIATYLSTAKRELLKKLSDDGNNERNDTIPNLIQEKNIIKFIDGLLVRDGNKSYTKIGFIRQPKQPGPLSDIEAMQKHKLSLLKLLHETTEFVANDDPADFSYTISADSLNYVNKLMREIDQQISNNINGIAAVVKQYYDDLVQQTENKISNFIASGITTIDTNPSEAREFIDEISNGKNILENLIQEMKNITTADQLSTILNITSFLTMSNMSTNISTISKLANFRTFLKIFYNSTLPTQQWVMGFTEITTYLLTSTNRLAAKAITAKSEIEGRLYNNRLKSADAIKAFFSTTEATIRDVNELLLEITEGYKQLSKIQDKIKSIADPTECMQQISENLNTMNIKFVNFIPSSTTQYTNHLEYLTNLSNMNGHSDNSFKCAEELNDAIKYLYDSKKWYSFLLQLYDKLSSYEIQKDTKKYNIVLDGYENKNVGSTDLKQFLQLCCQSLGEHMYDDIENIFLDKFKSVALQKVINVTLKDDVGKEHRNESCESKLVMKGQFVKLSEIIGKTCSSPIKSIEIFALHKVFIDTTLNRTGEKIQLSIIAPAWEIIGSPKIILGGKPGKPHNNPKAKSGYSAGSIGENGNPGLPGGPAGNFLGYGEVSINGENLNISVDGGTGGTGQRGGDGMYGYDSTTDEPVIECTDFSCFFQAVTNPFPKFVEDGFQVEETYRGVTQFHVLGIGAGERLDQTFRIYKNGGNGGNGGDGGRGGNGGNPGHVLVRFVNGTNPDISEKKGAVGSPGSGGIGGTRGKSSKSMISEIFRASDTRYYDLMTNKDFRFFRKWANYKPKGILDDYPAITYHLLDNTGTYSTASDGKSGISGNNRQGIAEPEATFLLNPSHTLNSYKNFLIENLNGNIRESHLRNFLDQLNRSEFVNDLYDVSGLLNEFYGLESQFHKLHKTTSFLAFYKSLLQRLNAYALRPKSYETSPEHKKVLNFLYTAIMSRICSINRGNDDFIIDIIGYLESITKDIETLNDFNLLVQINQSKNKYNAKIDSKINEAKQFIDSDITPEIDNIVEQTDNKIKSLIGELSAAQNAAKKRKNELIEEQKKLQNQLTMRYILGSFQIVSSFLAFAGPIGEAATAVIKGADTVSQNLALGGTGSINTVDKITALPAAVSKSVTKITDQYIAKQQVLKLQLDNAKVELNLMEKNEPSNTFVKELQNKISLLRNNIKESEKNIFQMNSQLKTDLKQYVKQLASERSEGVTKKAKLQAICVNINVALNIGEIGVDAYRKIQNEEAKISLNNNAIKEIDENIGKLKLHEENIYKIMIPTCKAVQESVQSLDKTLPGQSLSSLDVKKWKIQSTIKDLQLQVRKMTDGFSVEEDMKHCIEKLEYGMSAMIQVYDRIENYRENKEFADYLFDLNSRKAKEINITDTEFSNSIDNLKLTIQSNLVLLEYEKAMNALSQYKFPFVYLYLEEFQLPSHLRLANTTNNLISQVVQKLSSIKTKLEKSEASIDQLQARYTILDVTFDGNHGNVPSFFVWKYETNNEAISKLLQGHEITIEADISRALIKENAVKFKEIGIRLKLSNETLQAELDKELANLSVEMIHLGNSYYRCGSKIYVMSHDNQAISHSVNKNQAGKYEMRNEVYSKIQNNNPVLSPYTLWKIKLLGKNKLEYYNFSLLEKYLNQTIDLHLDGYGQYIKRKYISDICNNNLESYYTLHKVLSEIDDVDSPRNNSRRRRDIANDDNETTEPVEVFAKNFASRVTSPLNYAINWLITRIL